MSIARYKWLGNFTARQLDDQIPDGFTASIQKIGPEVLADIEVLPQLTGSQDDLDAFMATMGWTFVAEDPVSPVPASTTMIVTAPMTLSGPDAAYAVETSAGGFDVQVPAANRGRGPILVKNIGANTAGIIPTGGDLIDGQARLDLANIYDAATLYPDGATNWWVW